MKHRRNVMILPAELPQSSIISISSKPPKVRKGTVLKIGSEVTGVKIGDQVAYENVGNEIEDMGRKVFIVLEDQIQYIINEANV